MGHRVPPGWRNGVRMTMDRRARAGSHYRHLGDPVWVSCYSGHRHAERPLSFVHRDQEYRVIELESSWFEENVKGGGETRKACFRVRADDGNLYVLSRRERDDGWTLERVLYLT